MTDLEVLVKLREVLQAMKQNKPEERSELARRYAVSITEFEILISYFQTYVVNRADWPK